MYRHLLVPIDGTELSTETVGQAADFARALGLDRKHPLRAVGLLAEPSLKDIDVVRVTTPDSERHYVGVAAVGFDSAVNETANTMDTRLTGTARYVAAIAPAAALLLAMPESSAGGAQQALPSVLASFLTEEAHATPAEREALTAWP